MLSDEVLQHVGIKGMRWGVKRNRNRPGGADGKEESVKVKDKRSNLTKKLDSMKRERQWKQVLKKMHELDTKEINTVASRVKLENSMKDLSRSKIGNKKDRDDYLRREHMSDAELSRKVTRLRAKDNLHKAVKSASKEQREFGEHVVRIAGSVGIKYAITRKTPSAKDLFKDVFEASRDSKKASAKAKESILEKVEDPTNKDVLKGILDKIDKPKS